MLNFNMFKNKDSKTSTLKSKSILNPFKRFCSTTTTTEAKPVVPSNQPIVKRSWYPRWSAMSKGSKLFVIYAGIFSCTYNYKTYKDGQMALYKDRKSVV